MITFAYGFMGNIVKKKKKKKFPPKGLIFFNLYFVYCVYLINDIEKIIKRINTLYFTSMRENVCNET